MRLMTRDVPPFWFASQLRAALWGRPQKGGTSLGCDGAQGPSRRRAAFHGRSRMRAVLFNHHVDVPSFCFLSQRRAALLVCISATCRLLGSAAQKALALGTIPGTSRPFQIFSPTCRLFIFYFLISGTSRPFWICGPRPFFPDTSRPFASPLISDTSRPFLDLWP